MILTTVKDLDFFMPLNTRFPAAFAALRELAAAPFEKGRHEIDGSDIYINAVEYDTKPADGAVIEAHRKYIDVMWMLSGEELIDVCPTDALTDVIRPYSETDDAVLAQVEPGCTILRMCPGSVAILFPGDAHAPGLHAGNVSRVRKYIAKVRVN